MLNVYFLGHDMLPLPYSTTKPACCEWHRINGLIELYDISALD